MKKIVIGIIIIFLSDTCTMKKNIKVDRTIIEDIQTHKRVIKEEISTHFLIKHLDNGSFLALHFSRDWAFFSSKRKEINDAIRDYWVNTQGYIDPRGDLILKRAKKIVREHKSLIKELCHFLDISNNTDLTMAQIQAIDKKIKEKGSKAIYSKYYIQLGVFLGEIIAKKVNGSWVIKKGNDPTIFITYEMPVVKAMDGFEYHPWSRLGSYFEKDTGEFSLYLSISGITDGFGIYRYDFESN